MKFKSTSLLILFFGLIVSTPQFACHDKNTLPTPSCGTHNGNELHLGPQGGCYYINSNGNKTYVDRSECKC